MGEFLGEGGKNTSREDKNTSSSKNGKRAQTKETKKIRRRARGAHVPKKKIPILSQKKGRPSATTKSYGGKETHIQANWTRGGSSRGGET